MDISDTLAPNSDQLDAVDLLGGPMTFTIERVEVKGGEQPVNVYLREFPRPWRPGKSMRRVLVAAWGKDASAYVGRRVTLFCDPEVKFGGDEVGGTRISHLSHIAKPLSVPLLVSRGKSAVFTVQPLTEAAPDRLTEPTQRRLFSLLQEQGITDPEQQRAGMSRILGREIKSRALLTEDEGRTLIVELEARKAGQP